MTVSYIRKVRVNDCKLSFFQYTFILSFFAYFDLNQKLIPCRESKQKKFHRFVYSKLVKTCDELYLWHAQHQQLQSQERYEISPKENLEHLECNWLILKEYYPFHTGFEAALSLIWT